MTSYDLAEAVIEQNSPIDRGWVKYQKRSYTEKELKEICKEMCETAAPVNTTKQLIGRAASIVYNRVYC